jgi:Ca-activated chloride channel homolog
MLKDENHYIRLGIPRDATPQDIRSAYFEAARQLHPDTNPDPSALELFLAIQEAYEVLADPEKRAIYDSTLPEHESSAPSVSYSVLYSRQGILRQEEPQLVYVLLDMTSIPDPGVTTTPSLNLCLVLDRSTSMQGPRMDMVKANAFQLLKQIRPTDVISVVTYSDRADVLIPPTRVSDLGKLASRISLIQTGGGTEIYYGLDAGLAQVRRNQTPSYINHLILITDGRTYGDEDACLKLAEQAANEGIGISGLGIGSEWNDEFLDKMASITGGTSMFISSPQDLQNFLEDKCKNLGGVYAERVIMEFEKDPYVELRYAFRLLPDAGPLPTEIPIRLGNIAQFHSLRVLLEFQIDQLRETVHEVVLAKGVVKMEIPTRAIPAARLKLNLKLPVRTEVENDAPPQAIVQSMSRLTLYRMQEKARSEVLAGQAGKATRHLQQLATHLLAQGERDLAHTVLMEAESINKNQQFSEEGDKRIKYGTRALLLPPHTERVQS